MPLTHSTAGLAPASAQRRILIAEDDDDLRVIIVYALSQAFPAFEITAFSNGQDALEYFDRNSADLVISNHSMPLMDGPTFVRNLRMRSAELPILMVSGSDEAEEEGAAAGISCFLEKTEIASRLTPTVRALLSS